MTPMAKINILVECHQSAAVGTSKTLRELNAIRSLGLLHDTARITIPKSEISI